jgi:hypothetical protein
MEVYIGKRQVRGVPSSSTNGKPVWIKAGYYWQEGDKYIKLLTKSRSVLSNYYYANEKSLVPYKENASKQKLARLRKLKQLYALTCP